MPLGVPTMVFKTLRLLSSQTQHHQSLVVSSPRLSEALTAFAALSVLKPLLKELSVPHSSPFSDARHSAQHIVIIPQTEKSQGTLCVVS